MEYNLEVIDSVRYPSDANNMDLESIVHLHNHALSNSQAEASNEKFGPIPYPSEDASHKDDISYTLFSHHKSSTFIYLSGAIPSYPTTP